MTIDQRAEIQKLELHAGLGLSQCGLPKMTRREADAYIKVLRWKTTPYGQQEK